MRTEVLRVDVDRMTARRLDDLHMAYTVLRTDEGQSELLRSLAEDDDAPLHLRRMIAAALEDGLLRYSRRQEILAEARRLGLSDFQTQLLIAQVQFGDERIESPAPAKSSRGAPAERRQAWSMFAAVGVLAIGIFYNVQSNPP